MCGLKRRVNYPEFRDLIQNYDLFSVNETKLDQYGLINISDYTFLSKCRKRFIRKSGGIGVFVKDSLVPFFTMIDSESEYILWFRVNKQILCTDEDFLFGAVYLPPSDSRYNTSVEMENFELEITSMCILHKYVYLMGDYNSRTHNKADYLDQDNFMAKYFAFDDTMQRFFNISCMLDRMEFDKSRCSKDQNVNYEGNMLLDICKSNNLLILNGRCGKDRGTGAYTFKNTSIIDYSIASVETLFKTLK